MYRGGKVRAFSSEYPLNNRCMETNLMLKSGCKTDGKVDKVELRTYDVDFRKGIARFCFLVVTGSTVLFSQPGMSQEVGQQIGSIGEANVYSTLRFDVLSSDNALRASDGKVRSNGFRISPSSTLVANRRGLNFTVGYNGDFASFTESELDYNDHRLAGTVDAILGVRRRFTASSTLTFRHEDLGTRLTRGSANVGDDQVRATDVVADANYTYGALAAKYNITGGLYFESVTFQSRSDVTAGRDFLEARPYGRVTYRLSADTRALTELRFINFDYDNDSFDRSVVELLAGFSFQGTGKTTGELKVGIASNDYSDSRVEDTSVFVADIGLSFAPSSNSRIDVNINRETNSEEGLDFSAGSSQTINDTALIRWSSKWSGFAKSVVYVSYEKQNRECPISGTQTSEIGVELSVLPRRWVELGAGISSRNVTADDCGNAASSDLEYDLNEMLVFVRILP